MVTLVAFTQVEVSPTARTETEIDYDHVDISVLGEKNSSTRCTVHDPCLVEPVRSDYSLISASTGIWSLASIQSAYVPTATAAFEVNDSSGTNT